MAQIRIQRRVVEIRDDDVRTEPEVRKKEPEQASGGLVLLGFMVFVGIVLLVASIG